MANRRPFDSSHVAGVRNTYFQFKTLFLTLAFVSFLISIQCASFDHRSLNKREHQQPLQWQNIEPDYRMSYSSGHNNDINLKDLTNYDPYVVKQPAVELDLSEQEQSTPENHHSPSLSSSNDLDKLYQLLLARELATPSVSPPLTFDYQPGLDSTVYNSNNNYEDDLTDLNAKLADQLFHESKKLSPPQENQKYDDYDPKNPLYFLTDQSSDHDLNDKITLSRQEGDASDGASGGKDKDIYKLSIDESSEEGTKESSDSVTLDNQKNLTTLLEDEEVSTTEKSPVVVALSSDPTTTPTTVDEASSTTTTEPYVTEASYGSVVTASSELHDKTPKSSTSAMFHWFYNKLANYMPNISGLWRPHVKITDVTHHTNSQQNNIEGPANLTETERGDTRNSNNNNDKLANQEKQETFKTDDGELQADSSMTITSRSFIDSNDAADFTDPKTGTWTLDDRDTTSTDSDKYQDGSRSHGDAVSATTTHDSNGSKSHKGSGHKVSMLRQSSVVLPIKSNDELIIQSTDRTTHPDSLMGKYIYAPEHHYHLNAIPTHQSMNNKRVDVDDEQQMYSQMSQRSYLRRLHPGDEVYGSYNGFNPLFESQGARNQPLTGIVSGNKTNDVYFLVMVGAFCVMAMAMVMAAGLFAYRIQQNRKATQETDYPTYGVVGPNNMNGKCGAANFVGGYFGSASGPGSSSTGGNSKTGSVKQLADLYCGDNGLTAVNANNNNKTKKTVNEQNNTSNNNFMANQNAARMYHYQHQKQQMIISDRASAGGRHTSASDLDSEDENDDGTYTVYECPGLASAHDMEIKNPLFNDDHSP